MPILQMQNQGKQAPPSPRTVLAMMRVGIQADDIAQPTVEEAFLKYRDKGVAYNVVAMQEKRRQELITLVNEECRRITEYGVFPEEFELLGRPPQLEQHLLYNLSVSQLNARNAELQLRQVENNAKRAMILASHHDKLREKHEVQNANQAEAEERRYRIAKLKRQEIEQKSEQRQEKWQQIQSQLTAKEEASERKRQETVKIFQYKVKEQQQKIAEQYIRYQQQSNAQFQEEQRKIYEQREHDKQEEMERQRAFWEQARNAQMRQKQLYEQQRIEKEEKFLRSQTERQRAEARLDRIEQDRTRAYLQQQKAFDERQRQAEELRLKREAQQRRQLQEKAEELNYRISEYKKRRDSLNESTGSQKLYQASKTLQQFEKIEEERRETYRLMALAKAETEAKIEQTKQQAQMVKKREEYNKRLNEMRLSMKLQQIDEFKQERESLCQQQTEMMIRLNSLSEEERLSVSQSKAKEMRASVGPVASERKKFPRVDYKTQPSVKIVEQTAQIDKKSRGSYTEKLELQAKIDGIKKEHIKAMDEFVARQQKREQEMKAELEQAGDEQAKIKVLLDHKNERKQMCAQMNKLREEQNKELKYYLYLLEHRYSGVRE